MTTLAAPLDSDELKRRIVEFARSASTEVSTRDEDLVPALVKSLPAGTTVYVAHTPRATLDDVVSVALRVESAGFRASPHIVARRIENERVLRAALRRLRDGGIEQLLLVAGDRDPPAGPFSGTLKILDTGATVEAGFERLGVARHPEGHRAVGPTALWSALGRKQAFALRTGTKLHVVTQFGFDPRAVCAWERRFGEHGLDLPVHVGIAGPAPLPRLIRFAMQCGVGASMQSLMRNVSAMSRVARLATGPDEMLVGLMRESAAGGATRVVASHFYAFGGAVETARWLRDVIDGAFELDPETDRFVMKA